MWLDIRYQPILAPFFECGKAFHVQNLQFVRRNYFI